MTRGRRPKDWEKSHKEELKLKLYSRLLYWKKSELSKEEIETLYGEELQELEHLTILDENLIPWFNCDIYVASDYRNKKVKKYSFGFSTIETDLKRTKLLQSETPIDTPVPADLIFNEKTGVAEFESINKIPYGIQNKTQLKDILYYTMIEYLAKQIIEETFAPKLTSLEENLDAREENKQVSE